MKPGIWLENYHIDNFLLLIKYNFQEFSHCLCEPGESYIKDIIKDYRGDLDLIFVALINKNHWVTIRRSGGIWLIYDSLNYHIDSYQLFFKNILPRDETVLIKRMDVMIQVGGSDCGFFALAYVQSLVQGIEPESCQYNQEKMNHVYNVSIKNKTMNTFPYVIKDFQEREIFEIDLSDNYIYTTEENLIYNI